MPQVVFLACPPGRLRIEIGVSASLNDVCSTFPESPPDFFQHRRSSAVFDDIVEQSGDGEVFVASRFQHQRRHAHQVRYIWNRRGFAPLSSMHLGGEQECTEKPRPQLYYFLLTFSGHYCFSPRRMDKYARMNGFKSPSS